ncbi:MAG: hypothetical protein COT84_07290 [Chlamydiae bacterium CG10_big_fil_rev_8_21_14_0_10_35_9]|nr:MAG: hypothetical protein COT84_07290 [Chlamydiae bacterium CG10_big_fil_rev_8_21_14_0_10_35_9]
MVVKKKEINMQLPVNFTVQSKSESKIETQWESQANSLDPIPCCIPKEFGGPGGGYSPEDLFALSIVTCIIATFKVYTEKSNLSFETIDVNADLTVDKHPSENFLSMSHIKISIDVKGASDKERVEKTLNKAIQDCAVSNSVKTGKTFQINVS